MPLFTVIVPTYDRPELLAEALDSVRRQTCDDFECLVIEDAPPRSRAVLPNDPRFRLLRHARNRGVAAARNTGITHAEGDYIAFLDDDDVFTPRRLECVLSLLGPHAVAVCAKGRLDGTRAHHRDLQGDVRDVILDGFTPHLGQTSLRRQDCLPFDERYLACQDVEWWLRTSHRLPVRSTSELGYLMRRHDGARHGNGKSNRAHYSRALLDDYAAYFDGHPRAHAFRLERLARLEAETGDHARARATALRSVRVSPRPRSLVLAARLALTGSGI